MINRKIFGKLGLWPIIFFSHWLMALMRPSSRVFVKSEDDHQLKFGLLNQFRLLLLMTLGLSSYYCAVIIT